MRLFPVDVESSSTAYILFYHRVMPGDNAALRRSSRSPSLVGIEHEVGNILTGLSTEAAAPPALPAAASAELPSPVHAVLPPAPLQATLAVTAHASAPDNTSAPSAHHAASQQDTIMREASDILPSNPTAALPRTPSAPTQDADDMQM